MEGDRPRGRLQEIDDVLRQSARGLVFSGATAWRTAETIFKVVHTEGAEQISLLFRLLAQFARAPGEDRQVVASEWLGRPTDTDSMGAVEAGLGYIFENLTGEIRLATAAQLAYMSEPTFSKYFKSATGMTFSGMVKKAADRPRPSPPRHHGRRDRAGGSRQRLPQHGELQPAVPRRGGHHPDQLPQSWSRRRSRRREPFSLGLRAPVEE